MEKSVFELPEEEKKLLTELSQEKNISIELISKLVDKATEVRYQDKVIGFKDELSDLIKEYANDKKEDL